MIYRRLRPLCPRLHIKGFLIAGYPQFTRNYTPQNGIISSFSALSSISVLISNAFFVCLENEEILFP